MKNKSGVENLVTYHPIQLDEYGFDKVMSDTVYTELTANQTSYIYAPFPAPQSPTVSVRFQPDQTSKFTGCQSHDDDASCGGSFGAHPHYCRKRTRCPLAELRG